MGKSINISDLPYLSHYPQDDRLRTESAVLIEGECLGTMPAFVKHNINAFMPVAEDGAVVNFYVIDI